MRNNNPKFKELLNMPSAILTLRYYVVEMKVFCELTCYWNERIYNVPIPI